MNKIVYLLILNWAILLTACTTKGTNWDVDAYAPVSETTLDITKMIGDTNLQVMGDSSLWLNVDANIYSFTLDTLTEFPSLTVPFVYQWTFGTISLAGGASIPQFNTPINLNATGIELREMKLKEGKLRLDIKSSATERCVFTYSIPAATLGGIGFTFTDTIAPPAIAGDTSYYTKDFDVTNYVISTTGPGNDEVNTFSAFIDVHSIAGDPNMTITNNQILFSVTNTMIGIVPYYGKGYLGQYDLSQNNATGNVAELKLFQSGLIDVEQISLNLTLHNYIGADVRFKPNYMKATNTNNGNFINLNHSSLGNTVNINRAFETGNVLNPVNPVLYTFSFTSLNSNIESIVELLPDRFDFSADMNLNPYGNIGGYTDFYYTDYPAKIQMQLQAPLKFSISQLLFEDTIDNPFASLDILDNIIDGQFIIRTENKFPLALNLQLFTLDSMGTTTDSVFVSDLIPAATVNALNRVTTPVITDLIATVDAVKIGNLKSAANIRIKAKFNTQPPAAGRLQMYSDYYLNIKLIADIKYHIIL